MSDSHITGRASTSCSTDMTNIRNRITTRERYARQVGCFESYLHTLPPTLTTVGRVCNRWFRKVLDCVAITLIGIPVLACSVIILTTHNNNQLITMMFSRIALLAAVVQVSQVGAFAPLQYRTSGTSFGRSSQLFAVEDLEAKLLGESPKPAASKAKAPVKETKAAAAVKSSAQSELSLLKSEMPQYESTATATPKAKPEKPKPVPKPKPAPVPKAVQPAPAPKVEKPKPVPKPKPVAVVKPKPVAVAKPAKKFLPPPPKPQPAASGDFQTVATGGTLFRQCAFFDFALFAMYRSINPCTHSASHVIYT